MHYRFDLLCPRCGKRSETTTVNREPPPHVKCGDCLMNDVEVVEFNIVGVTVLTALLAAILLFASDAHAQQGRTVYGADGRVQARTLTDSRGSTTIYDTSGRVTGRTSTDSSGTTTVYGADGRVGGRIDRR
jgi:YD repeat-containing protein